MSSFTLATRPERRMTVLALVLGAALACAWLLARDPDGAAHAARHWLGFLHPQPSLAPPADPGVPARRPESGGAGDAGSVWPL